MNANDDEETKAMSKTPTEEQMRTQMFNTMKELEQFARDNQMRDCQPPPEPTASEALFAFMGWLTSSDFVSGPFSSRHSASQAAELVGLYYKQQGWSEPRDNWADYITPGPAVNLKSKPRPNDS